MGIKVVIPGLEIIELRFMVVYIATLQQRIDSAENIRPLGTLNIVYPSSPGIIGIGNHQFACAVGHSCYIALGVKQITE